jgi:DNA-binding MarR family transcriptional regulator
LKVQRKLGKRRLSARTKLKNSSRRITFADSASQRRDARLQANAIPPGDAKLREFVADLYAAMSMMRLLRQEIASTLSLTSAEYSVLLAVWYLERENEMTVRAIADHLHVAAAYVTSEITRLVKNGLLTKKPDKLDRRAVGVRLTKAARDLLSELEPMLREINRPLFNGLSVRDLATVHRFLQGIIEHGHEAIKTAKGFQS